MGTNEPQQEAAHRAADLLALALEDVGFDVGREFPLLRGGSDRDGHPAVHFGHVTEAVAVRLARLLSDAARQGVVSPKD